MPYKFWLTTEIKFLRKNIKTMPLPELAKHLNRTEEGVIRKAYELGIQPTQPMNRWSAEDLHIAKTLPPEEAAAQTGRTLQSIRMKLSRLKAAYPSFKEHIMSEVKRYGSAVFDSGLIEMACGDYVTYSDYQKLVAENAALKEVLEYAINTDNAPEYHSQGMGCGVEDNGLQRDGYAACNYGWDSALERVYSEVLPDALPETPATDAAIAEIKSEEAQNMYESILDNPSVYDMESLVDSLESYAENKKVFAANLRAGRKE